MTPLINTWVSVTASTLVFDDAIYRDICIGPFLFCYSFLHAVTFRYLTVTFRYLTITFFKKYV